MSSQSIVDEIWRGIQDKRLLVPILDSNPSQSLWGSLEGIAQLAVQHMQFLLI